MRGELADLHIHVGGAVAPHVLWSIAHQQGFKLPVKNYFEFVELITARPERASPNPSSARSAEPLALLRLSWK